jgi:hypothetical protein
MGMICRKPAGEITNTSKNSIRKCERKTNLGDLEANGRIILKWILMN